MQRPFSFAKRVSRPHFEGRPSTAELLYHRPCKPPGTLSSSSWFWIGRLEQGLDEWKTRNRRMQSRWKPCIAAGGKLYCTCATIILANYTLGVWRIIVMLFTEKGRSCPWHRPRRDEAERNTQKNTIGVVQRRAMRTEEEIWIDRTRSEAGKWGENLNKRVLTRRCGKMRGNAHSQKARECK